MLIVNAGIGLFFCLYFSATLSYPGGTQADAYSSGFSWSDNYWCNLLNATAINGAYNSARPFALVAMIVLCLTLAVFWYGFPVFAGMGKTWIKIIRYTGMAAMTTAFFLFMGPHDIIINTASLFGLVAVLGTLNGLYQLQWKGLFIMGILNLVLVVINNICYYNEELLMYLPVVQKISFVFFLSWISLISLNFSASK
jgi:hypothetical protein